MKVNASDFIDKILIPLNEGWGYIWGTAGAIWTAAAQRKATRKQTKAYGSKWIGKHVCDCSGLVLWALRQLGVSVPHSSSSQHRLCDIFGDFKNGARADGKPLKPGTLVFMRNGPTKKPWNHVGVYIGNGICVESKGTKYGVVMSPVSTWVCWGELKYIDYTNEDGDILEPTRPTIRKGNTGEDVKYAQELLKKVGYLAGEVDGVFGTQTQLATKNFQGAYGLTPDGVIGPMTWRMLQKIAEGPTTYYNVYIKKITKPEVNDILKSWPNAEVSEVVD